MSIDSHRNASPCPFCGSETPYTAIAGVAPPDLCPDCEQSRTRDILAGRTVGLTPREYSAAARVHRLFAY